MTTTRAVAARGVTRRPDDSRLALMGVTGAFVFAAQMINFAIPGTGASGHLGGGLLLAALLGPHAGFLVMASVLAVQALFFADGGLLVYGANAFNLGFITCFLAYPLLLRPLLRGRLHPARLRAAALLSAIVALQIGSLGVVLETLLSGRTELPAGPFLLLMQPIYLVVGIVEGLITAGVLGYVWRARPALLESALDSAASVRPLRPVLLAAAVAAICLGGIGAWFAATQPDGLEWSISRLTPERLQADGPVHATLGACRALPVGTAVFSSVDGQRDRGCGPHEVDYG